VDTFPPQFTKFPAYSAANYLIPSSAKAQITLQKRLLRLNYSLLVTRRRARGRGGGRGPFRDCTHFVGKATARN